MKSGCEPFRAGRAACLHTAGGDRQPASDGTPPLAAACAGGARGRHHAAWTGSGPRTTRPPSPTCPTPPRDDRPTCTSAGRGRRGRTLSASGGLGHPMG